MSRAVKSEAERVRRIGSLFYPSFHAGVLRRMVRGLMQ
jgi:hypothetical protein